MVYSSLTNHVVPYTYGNWGKRNLNTIKYIVIHGTVSTTTSAVIDGWRSEKNPSGRQASAEYMVKDNDIYSMMGEEYVTWHCGGLGTITNNNSIGIEHVNNYIPADAHQATFSKETLETGARLVADICKRYNIPPTRHFIVGHREVSPTGCPQTLNLDKYVERVQHYYYNKQENKQEKGDENDMRIIFAEGAGYGLLSGGKFVGLGDSNDIKQLEKSGVSTVQVSKKTFNSFAKEFK